MVNYIQVAILILLDFVVQCKFERNLLFKLKSRNPYFTRFCCAILKN